MSSQSDRPAYLVVLRAIGRILVGIAVVIYTLLDELLFPLFRPLIGWLGHFRLFERLGALIGASPPYLVLLFLAVPFVLIEPAKVYALVLFATGHLVSGAVLLLVAQVLSLLICERIYHSGHAPLMRIGWFKLLMGWIIRLRDKALGLVKSSPAWHWAAGIARGIRAWFRGLVGSSR